MSRREIALSPYVWWTVAAAFTVFSVACFVCWAVVPPFTRPRTLILAIGLGIVALGLALSPAPQPDSRATHIVIALAYLGTSAAMFLLAPESLAALPAAIFVGPLAAVWLEDPREIIAHYLAATIALFAPVMAGVVHVDTLVATCTIVPPTFVLGFCIWYVLSGAEEQADRLEALVKRDALTGVGNRRLLDERLDAELSRHATTRRPLSVFALDLNAFKAVNDQLGHATGDQLLMFVGARLTAAAGPRATVARQGGDEFCVLMPETDAAGAREVARRLRECLAPTVSAGVGHATFPDDARDASTLLELADARLVAGKGSRRDGHAGAPDGRAPIDLEGLRAAIALTPTLEGSAAHEETSETGSTAEPTISRAQLGLSPLIWRVTSAMFAFYALVGVASIVWAPQLSGPLFPYVLGAGALVSIWIAWTAPPAADSIRSHVIVAFTYIFPTLAVLTCLPGGAVALGCAVFIGALVTMRCTSRVAVAIHTALAIVLFGGVAALGLTDVATGLGIMFLSATTVVMVFACLVVFEATEGQGRELEHLAVVDPLTGLANRRRLVTALDEQARRCQSGGLPLTVLALDLNGFKALNDGAGHSAGDELLVDVAETLRSIVGLPALIARPGGDEFTVVLPDRDPAEADRIAHAIKAAIARLSRAGHPISTGIGRSAFPADGASAASLLGAADHRLLADKYGMRGAATA